MARWYCKKSCTPTGGSYFSKSYEALKQERAQRAAPLAAHEMILHAVAAPGDNASIAKFSATREIIPPPLVKGSPAQYR